MLTAFQLLTVIYFCLETKCVETHTRKKHQQTVLVPDRKNYVSHVSKLHEKDFNSRTQKQPRCLSMTKEYEK